MPDAPALLPEWLDDVVMQLGPVPPSLPGATADGVLWFAAPGRFWLEVPGVGRYLACEGRSLTIEPLPGADPETVGRLARTTPLAALCYQRGLAVWHAATAVRDGEAIVLAGDSGTGKSTLLAALLARGWAMAGDELAPVLMGEGGEVTALPVGGEVRLWADAIERLRQHPGLGEAIPGGSGPLGPGPHWLATRDRLVDRPVSVRSIWRLALRNEAGIEITAEQGFDRFDAVGRLAFNGRIAHVLLDRGTHMKIAAAIAAGVPHYQARRPRAAWTLPELVDAIEQGCAA